MPWRGGRVIMEKAGKAANCWKGLKKMKRIGKCIGAVLLCCLLAVGAVAQEGAQLSQDVYSFQIVLDGQLYAFPMPWEQFIQMGWVYDGDASQPLDAGYYTYSEVFEKGELQCYADVINFDISALPLEKCYVAGISFDQYQAEKAGGLDLTLPGGLVYGQAVQADAEAAYGTPSDIYEGEYYTQLTYEYESYRDVELEFSAETGTLSGVSLRNFNQPEDFVASPVSQQVPDIAAGYQAPQAVGESLDSFALSYAGSLYQLPAPVSAFLDNGWTLVAEDSAESLAGRDFGWVTLMYDNQRLRTLAQNYSGQATSVANCFVTEVEASDQCKVDILLPKGIALGMSQEQLEAALEGETVEKEDGSLYTYYEVRCGDSFSEVYEIYLQDGAVYKITAQNAPSYDDFAGAQ